MSAGYSGKPLIEKLGYQAGDSVYIFDAPDWFVQDLQAHGILSTSTLPTTWAHLFVQNRKDLEQLTTDLALNDVQKAIWVSWPKKASQVPTDITEQTLRDVILPLGWVDVKVAAVDETWSGLKFTRRLHT
jgi:hypothetical protein